MGNEKTPWNPSRTATERVKNPLPAPAECPHCRSSVSIAHHDEIYGCAYGDWPWAYLCDGCGAYVGMHPFTAIPLGSLAGPELRKARRECKPPFETLWTTKRMTRDEAYAALAAHMGIEKEECHFGWFDVQQCEKARAWAVATARSLMPTRAERVAKSAAGNANAPGVKIKCPDCGKWVKRIGMDNHRKDAHRVAILKEAA